MEADPELTDRSSRGGVSVISANNPTLTVHPSVGNETELKKFDNGQPFDVDFQHPRLLHSCTHVVPL